MGCGSRVRADLHLARAQHRRDPAAGVHRLGVHQGPHRQPAAAGDAGRRHGRGRRAARAGPAPEHSCCCCASSS
ncbi:MAG: hypothetical protein MZU91_01515 [Desulfosudis oleivorans]|nr:hypothetical protein [Desulfosudis oleivorans]